MKIAILGTGAIGSLFACKLSTIPENEILCVVKKPEHAENISKSGITIAEKNGESETYGPFRGITDTSNEPPADIVLISVKSQLTLNAVTEHRNLFGKNTIVVTLQNGYGNHEDILTVADSSRIVMGTTAQGVNISDDGVINHAGNGVTIIGPLDPSSEICISSADTVEKLLSKAGFETTLTDNVKDAIFKKLLINVGINAVCTLNGVENKYIHNNPQMKIHARQLVYEAVDILDIAGYTYDKDKIWEEVESVAEKTGANICSMLQDVRNKRETEIRRINGAIVDIARSEHIDAPLNHQIVSEIENQFPF